MDDMLKDFVVEAKELAASVEDNLLLLERDPQNKETLNAVFRSFHTIKGGAGFMNLAAMVSACHLTENLFDALRTGQAPVTPLAIEAALRASSFVADQLADLDGGAPPERLASMPSELESILLDAIAGKADIEEQPSAAPSSPAQGPDWEALYRAVSGVEPEPFDALDLWDEPADAPKAAPAPESRPDPRSPEKKNDDKPADARAASKEESIRVDAAKLDALLEVAGESVQAANQAAVLVERLSQFKFEGPAAALMANLAETIERSSRYSAELQRATLATRMQPVGRLFQKFPRLVRDLARDLGKEVELEIEGAETEVDRVVVDSLYDPLVHMLRNALDHGVETPQQRLAAGKPAKAFISLRAWQEANSVMIVLQDDGKGMDPAGLRKKAREKGLIGEHDASSDEEAYQLVFLPGFSTKEVASSVSGRGVGMDVVKTAVEKNRGAIHIDSQLGKGTTFSIRLPIEMSIVPTMLVSTSGCVLALPMAMVERVVELPDDLQTLGGAPLLRDQGRALPVRSLAGSLGYAACEERLGVIISAPKPYVMSVAGVDGAADLVIKPLTALAVEGISGTARSAEGELVLVVGLSFLMDGGRVSS